jgi:hypothetical protein
MSVHAIHVSGDAPNMVSSVDPNFAHSDLTKHDQIADLGRFRATGQDGPAFLKAAEATQHVDAVHAAPQPASSTLFQNAHTPTGTRVDATR